MELILYLIVLTVASYAVFTDLRNGTISNIGCVIIAFLFLLLAYFVPNTREYLPRFLIASLAFAMGFLCWMRGWIGAGDVKLFTVLLLWVPVKLLSAFFLAMAIFSLLTALVIAIYSRYREGKKTKTVPYAVPIVLSFTLASFGYIWNL